MRMHLKNCFDCGVIITPKSRRTLRCAECAKSRKKVLQKKWAQNNREHIREYNKRWYIAMIHAQDRIAVIRREHLHGVSEIDTLRAQNREMAEIIGKLLTCESDGKVALNLDELRERIKKIKEEKK
jgi:hypothetical protein